MTALALAAVAYDMAGAINATGIGETRIKKALADGDLVGHYNGNRLILRAVDLDEWIQTLPTENPSARQGRTA